MKDGRTARHMFDQSNSLYPSASVLELVQISQHCDLIHMQKISNQFPQPHLTA